jgi:hypothetical protein
MKGWDLRTVDLRAHWPGIRLSSDDGRAVVLEICAGESLQGDLGVQDDVQRLGSTSSWFSLRLPATVCPRRARLALGSGSCRR